MSEHAITRRSFLAGSAGVAALAAGALRAAHLTVLVNTTSLAGDPVAEALEAEADGLLAAYIPRADALAAAVADAIRKGA